MPITNDGNRDTHMCAPRQAKWHPILNNRSLRQSGYLRGEECGVTMLPKPIILQTTVTQFGKDVTDLECA